MVSCTFEYFDLTPFDVAVGQQIDELRVHSSCKSGQQGSRCATSDTDEPRACPAAHERQDGARPALPGKGKGRTRFREVGNRSDRNTWRYRS
jgi:hypothetical protein